jgi:hypothetical protein
MGDLLAYNKLLIIQIPFPFVLVKDIHFEQNLTRFLGLYPTISYVNIPPGPIHLVAGDQKNDSLSRKSAHCRAQIFPRSHQMPVALIPRMHSQVDPMPNVNSNKF